MEKYDPRVDAYIDKSADFAKPILSHIREMVHRVAPELSEAMKWGFPFFDYKGPVCQMAAFKRHCAFGFWREKMLNDPKGYLKVDGEESSAGSFGQIFSISDLPPEEVLVDFIHQALAINEKGVKVEKKPAAPKAGVEMPAEFDKLLRENLVAMDNFEKFSPSKKREYLEWFAEAKSDATRQKRIDQALEWIAEGKSRHWKYQ
ncbi:MAG TPA: YdeI/OmpD-associated family protein [Mucilaginibacter sp.]|nr:YdeI/OmpD-associated family protein [Mucilaginibacter sp.]